MHRASRRASRSGGINYSADVQAYCDRNTRLHRTGHHRCGGSVGWLYAFRRPSESIWRIHSSHADFVLLWAALTPYLRTRTFPVAAADYWDRNIVRRYLATQVFRAVLVERNRKGRTITQSRRWFRRSMMEIRSSCFLRERGATARQLLPFKCGIYHLAHARPNVELVPIWIDNLYRVLPKGAIIPAPLLCSATFGEPTHLLPGEDKKAFLERLYQTVTRLGASCAMNRC